MFLENVVPSANTVLTLPDLEYIRMPEAIFTRTATNWKKCVSIAVYTKNLIHEESDLCMCVVGESETAVRTALVWKEKKNLFLFTRRIRFVGLTEDNPKKRERER